MPSASKALRSKWIGRPKELVPSTTVSISERIGQPAVSSVTPSSASSAALAVGGAAAVAPHRGDDERIETRARGASRPRRGRSRSIPAIPRLPTVIATRPPGGSRSARRLSPMAWADRRGDVGDLGLLEMAAHAGDGGKAHEVAWFLIKAVRSRASVQSG